ncbi:MAG: T9SS type A sorting domain-containing protein [Bacteroidetes bacterium]|nr:T9SS type A sorting domain-containing protein [Bacteroidota bacterium]
MKIKLFYSAGIFLLSLLFFNSIKAINTTGGSTQSFNPGKKFLITAMHSGFNPTNSCSTEFSSYSLLRDTLRFNGWHRYGCWFSGDNVFGDSSVIADGIASTLYQNNQHELRTIFDRPIIRYLGYGQRSDYQCEQVATGTDYYFHAFETSITNTFVSDITDNNFNGGGAKVKFCSLNASEPGVWSGYIVKDLRSNREQCNRIIDHTRDDIYNWYVKPRIRIDTAFANNPANRNVVVCRIDIFDWNGDTVKKVDIRVKNLMPSDSIYRGKYIDEFFFSTSELNLILSPTDLCPTTTPMKEFYNWDADIRTDFRVYWYGECDMYIDYIRVENEPANQLFNVNNNLYTRCRNQLVSEINIAASNYNSSDPIPNNFYNEEFEFNMTPSTQELSKIIDSISSGKLSFMVNLNMDMYNVHIPRYWESHFFNASDFKKYLINSSRIKIVLPTPYFLEGWKKNDPLKGSYRESYNPNTLPVYHAFPGIEYDSVKGLLAYPDSPSNYDNWLQFNLDDRSIIFNFKKVMKICDELSKDALVDIIDLHQSHLWNQYNHKLKEPTNEELELTANLALTYGSKGFMYFAYNGVCEGNGYNTTYAPSGNPPAYSAGFVDKNKNIRDINAYGQNKWDFFKKYDRLLEKWGPYLMSFDNANRKSYIVRSEMTNLTEQTFFTDVLSYKPDPVDYSSPLSTSEPVSQRYLQAAVFNNPNEQYNKYFMIVNRRCSPFINDSTNDDNNGGRRFVKIKLHSNSDKFAGFNNWEIIDLENNSTVLTFDKRITSLLNLNWFLPGEGKLYKLSPVMQEGGTLVADESVSNIQFVCNGTVLNNGKNITIGSGTEIFFREGAGINMTGGNFICDGSQGNDNILLKGNNAELWNGINLINTGSLTKIEKTTFESTKSPVVIDNSQFGAQYAQKIIRRNIFYITHDSGIALRIRNQFAMLIDSNTFNVSNNNSTSGIYFSNYSDPGPAGGTPEDNYFVNITNNTFSGAYFPVLINDLGTAYSSFYMYNNQFQNTGLFGITGMKITGTIKNNRFLNSTENYCIYLSLSNPDIYGNYFSSDKRNMVLTASYPDIAPLRNNNNQLIWKGGRNGFNVNEGNDTIAKENIYLKSSLPITDLGENSFSVPNSSSYHIFGSISSDDSSQTYLTKRNCWIGNNDIPKIFIFNPLDTPVIQIGYIFTPVKCIPSENTSNEITEIGFGMYDTTFISEYDSTDILSEDEALYSEAREMLSNGIHPEAITDFKALIDEFHTSDYIYSSEDHLYESYRGLDTSENQEVTDILFSDLKQYLETKISIGHYDEDFDDNAYEIILMCEQKLENYNSALSGYEFISLYHPDAYRRIQASWEYDNIESILGGMGGGESDYRSQILDFGLNSQIFENEINKRFTRINEYADKDPATGKIRQNYLKANAEKKANEDKKAYRDFKESKTTNILNTGRSNEHDDKLIERAKQNLFLSKRTSKEEKERRRFEDLKLILNPDNLQAGQKETDNLIPVQYSLSQNYPNPFNPNTKFKFSLPADNRVSITVYDLLGREVVKLMNHNFRKAGVYTVEFTAKNLASGVYFYKLEAGNFVQTKRMVLLK